MMYNINKKADSYVDDHHRIDTLKGVTMEADTHLITTISALKEIPDWISL